MLDGSLRPSALGSSVPPMCQPQLNAVPGAIYALSTLCASTPSHNDLRRFDLDPAGNIVSSSAPLSLGSDLPSSNGSPLTFVASPEGKFAYVWSQTLDAAQHISPVQIGSSGQLTVKPELGISFPPVDSISCQCGVTHIPDAVVRTPNGLLLSVQDLGVNASEQGLHASYTLYKLDEQTGGIWTIPVVFGSAVNPGAASFIPANLPGGLRLVFSSTGKYLYVVQWDGTFASIQGFQIDQATGALTLLPGSPWPIGNVEEVT